VMAHFRGGFHPYNDPARRKWQDPEAILNTIGLKPEMALVDVGCGAGFFAIPAARMVGEKGKVYGIDGNPAAIEALREEGKKEGLKNLYLTAGAAEDVIVCRACADVIFFGISLHDFQDPSKVLSNARLMIKPGGKLIDLDWKKEGIPIGPPSHIKFEETYASQLIEAAGFKVESVKDSPPYHYLITAKPV
jgi:ubiquinone/menaquinone biosynthesis C-methylase UbiE